MAWCTYPRNETLVHQQFSATPLSPLTDSAYVTSRIQYTTYKIIATCIERVTALRANITREMHEYKQVKACLVIHDW